MIKKWNKSSRKGMITILLVITMILTTIIPIWAEGIPIPDISPWAMGTLNEGERYGIYSTEWYFDDFKGGISEDRLEELLINTGNKIGELELNKKEDFTPIPSEGDRTRGDVVTRLYNVLAQYDIPVGKSAIQYMQEQKILQGTAKGLNLDKICTTEEAVIFATRLIENTYNLMEAGSKGLAWKIEHNDNTIYFLGSIHVGNNKIYPIDKKLKEAFYQSDALIVEANLFDQSGGIEYFLEKARYEDGVTLEDNISEETYEKMLKIFDLYDLPEEIYNQSKPWQIANDLAVISSSSSENLEQGAAAANLGIDLYFLTNALLLNKPIIELEGIKYQADLFDGLSARFQEEYLNLVLDSILEPPTDEALDSSKQLEKWLNQWKNGDIEGFTTSYTASNTESESELTNMLFGQRDKNMAEKLVEILESDEKGIYFVVVGAGHFVEDNTVFHHLREKGYKVEVFK